MSGETNDRRTPEQVAATIGFVVATDSFMSGWGHAPGHSYFAVPFSSYESGRIVEANMRARREMKRVRFHYGSRLRLRMRAGDHLSICDLDESDRFHTPHGFCKESA